MFGNKELNELKKENAELKAKLELIRKVLDGESYLSATEVEGWRARNRRK